MLRWLVHRAKPPPTVSRSQRQQDSAVPFEKRDFSDTTAVGFFERQQRRRLQGSVGGDGAGGLQLRAVACGLDDPVNIGGCMRLSGFFGSCFRHLHFARSDNANAQFWANPAVKAKVAVASCNALQGGGTPDEARQAGSFESMSFDSYHHATMRAAQMRSSARPATMRKRGLTAPPFVGPGTSSTWTTLAALRSW